MLCRQYDLHLLDSHEQQTLQKMQVRSRSCLIACQLHVNWPACCPASLVHH